MGIYDNKHNIYGDNTSLGRVEDRFATGVFTSPATSYEIALPQVGFDVNSLIFIKTYNELYRRNFKSRIIINTNSNTQDELDFSPLINELAKLFELELNLSIVQWIRQREGIEMPTFYNKYKNDNKEYIWQGKLNLNQRERDGSLRGVPIGNSYFYAENMFRQSIFPDEFTAPKEMLSVWNTIREVRNTASHASVSSFVDYEKMILNFRKLIDNGYFEELISLKKRLQSD